MLYMNGEQRQQQQKADTSGHSMDSSIVPNYIPNGFPEEPRNKKSQNMTECVPVPSSEHVAEIVGRQGEQSISNFSHLQFLQRVFTHLHLQRCNIVLFSAYRCLFILLFSGFIVILRPWVIFGIGCGFLSILYYSNERSNNYFTLRRLRRRPIISGPGNGYFGYNFSRTTCWFVRERCARSRYLYAA